MSFKVDVNVPDKAVAGDPDNGDDFDVYDAVLFAADLVGGLKYVMPPVQRDVVFN